MSNFAVVFDSCVLVPMHTRNLAMWMASTGLFRTKWSERIHDEWTRNAIRIKGEKVAPGTDLSAFKAGIVKTRKDMDSAVSDALVTGYESHAAGLKDTDEKDRHVAAVAIASGAALIVTYNLKDFSNSELAKHQVEAKHPDEFFSDLADLDPTKILEVTRLARIQLKNPPHGPDEYIQILQKHDLKEFGDFLLKNKNYI